ncbi:dihydrouridine synthase (Dus) domain-containing protein [Hirsutella rhossiliensis]|uniref:tRNA-dihydrouridine(47) synthase [NAD(P)(+)] n=1 Tax=Hirsutella rhossiliensis TaxID=111463 RepID=A0A9P8MUM3_9HYPO|nr:dihydrouridine synthase (Dus) domain-containing protein [Hirsutella rhossiliensis]KAH0962428.1 dihydrouridine synthase (Dus) domain-containing protein [Hirsutella rhossiliensis]
MPEEDEAPPPQGQSQLTTDESSVPPTEERAAKRLKMDVPADSEKADATVNPASGGASPAEVAKVDEKIKSGAANANGRDNRQSGLAPIKKEYLIDVATSKDASSDAANDDEAEGRGGRKDRKKNKGQNTGRTFGKFDDTIRLCNSRAFYPEFSPRECRFGDRCKLSHDLRKYFAEGRRDDVDALGGKCHVFEQYGSCPSGWKCRFVKSHMQEIEREDGRKELVLLGNSGEKGPPSGAAEQTGEAGEQNPEAGSDEPEERRPGVFNVVGMEDKIKLSRKRLDFSKADEYIKWMNSEADINHDFHHRRKDQSSEGIEDLRARYVDPPFKPSEKRRLYFGPETPTLAPLTTQGNLPFRRLCVELGCQVTYSEMAMSMPLLQGSKTDWTLMKAHESEVSPPKFNPGRTFVFDDYDNSKDLKFGAQVSGHQPWMVTKAASALSRLCPQLRLIDLNCGCPIDMIFKAGGGSALLESQGKMERMIRGMNAVSGPIPITAKIRTGVKSNRPVAPQLLGRLAFGSREHRARLGAPGCAAVTLHGRSREQRYTRKADWAYIGECAALIKSYNEQKDALTDTAAEPDESTLPNAKDGRMYFLGNGDCYSHVDYLEHVDQAHVDSVMIGRGALIKPWIFEEIEKGQYLDKSSSERLGYVEKFARYGLEAWGSDEVGLGFTRRFLLEWLSFAHRYVPIGLLERLPPSLNDRPPAYKGRDELETLMASTNYRDWIKITEMFLGPVHPGFQFQPKHKSNAYEAEG